MLDFIKSGTMYTMGRSGRLEPIKVEGFEIGQRISYARDGQLGYVTGQTDTGYTIITDDLLKLVGGMTADSLSPFTRIHPAEGRTITAEEIAELEARVAAKRAADKIEADKAAKEHAEEVTKLTAELRAKYPNATNRYPGKNLKAELVKAFPGVKFSVTSDYNSINIGWTDGPTEEQIKEYSSKYQRGHFNGMEDIYEYDRSAYSDAVSSVLGSVNYVFENRKITKELLERIEADLLAQGIEPDGYGRTHRTVYDVEIYGEYNGLELISGSYVPQFSGKAPEPKEAPEKTISGPVEGVTVRENPEKKGIEILFSRKPAQEVLDALHAQGFHWHKYGKYWYNFATDETRAFAHQLAA